MCMNQSAWKIWKTVQLGTGVKDAESFREAIQERGMRLGDWANNIIDQPEFTVAPGPTEVDLVLVAIAELGFPAVAKLRDIYQAVENRGFRLCPAEVGPQLRLQYPDQPAGESLAIGMEPSTISDGSLRLFDVAHLGDGQWLLSCYGHPECRWPADHRFVFVLPSE
jgi:hypothetical protein